MPKSFARLEGREAPEWFATCDPRPLGSGGGTAFALLDACRASGQPFGEWINARRRLIIHAGGQSRRLPAYAAVGKALMPIPAIRGSRGQRADQALVDLQVELSDALFDRAPEGLRAMVISGDALLRLDKLPSAFPDADIVCLGMAADPQTASHFGVFYVGHEGGGEPAFFLQKPPAAKTTELSGRYHPLLDTGIWFFSERALRVLMAKSGVSDPDSGAEPEEYELYSEFGLALGTTPTVDDEEIGTLKTIVVPVRGEFFHFGTSEQMIDSVTRLHDQGHQSAPLGFLTSARRHPHQHVANARFDGPPPFASGGYYWVENAHVPPTWRLEGDNVVTGVPVNDWSVALRRGVCLDIVPVEGGLCVRPYGFDDSFRGPIGDSATQFLNRPLEEWLTRRNLQVEDLGASTLDLQSAPLFPIVARGDESAAALIDWMVAETPTEDFAEVWKNARRFSASNLLRETDGDALYAQRAEFRLNSLKAMQRNHGASVFYSLDLERAAEEFPDDYMPAPIGEEASLTKQMHDAMFRSALLRKRGDAAWEDAEAEAFGALRHAILGSLPEPNAPECGVAQDQIVWGRSPLRFDLAGGWTDTPPYCLLNGGRVLNVSVDLNGQPPVQVFIRLSERPDVLLRSIDLGTERRYPDFQSLTGDLTEKSEFSLAQAALLLAGFSPTTGSNSLHKLLENFGGGIEMSLLSAVPKGSGLGTSSILASTILASLNEFCRLGWSQADVLNRTLAMEQMLGTGGGWQDQSGGCLPGIKVLETQPGLLQSPLPRWLPEQLLGPEYANHTALLYYTGITRVAKSVLREIVRGMFLNSGPRLATLRKIGENVDPTVDAIQRRDWEAFGHSVRRSWELNQELDSGTNPPSVQAILAKVEDHLLGAKLLGAGGGGFLFMVAKDPEAAARVRRILAEDPPSPRARFFDFRVSPVGLEVTKS